MIAVVFRSCREQSVGGAGQHAPASTAVVYQGAGTAWGTCVYTSFLKVRFLLCVSASCLSLTCGLLFAVHGPRDSAGRCGCDHLQVRAVAAERVVGSDQERQVQARVGADVQVSREGDCQAQVKFSQHQLLSGSLSAFRSASSEGRHFCICSIVYKEQKPEDLKPEMHESGVSFDVCVTKSWAVPCAFKGDMLATKV